ncbi:hypothetical protein [Enterovibrio norvegicus]|uniref:hypothetical protein n=1 Tax=Enterovibrio norvegicus TaxID=188144 RepID=UPI00352C5C55
MPTIDSIWFTTDSKPMSELDCDAQEKLESALLAIDGVNEIECYSEIRVHSDCNYEDLAAIAVRVYAVIHSYHWLTPAGLEKLEAWQVVYDDSIEGEKYVETTTEKVKTFLEAAGWDDTLFLLKCAINLAKRDEKYKQVWEKAICHGSTIEYRHAFSQFGNYWSTDVRHGNAVDGFDSAMCAIKEDKRLPGHFDEMVSFLREQRERQAMPL